MVAAKIGRRMSLRNSCRASVRYNRNTLGRMGCRLEVGALVVWMVMLHSPFGRSG